LYADTGEFALASEAMTSAYALKDRTSDPEKFFIETNYDLQVTGNLVRAQQTSELWAQTYPRDVFAHSLLGSMTTQGTGRFEQSMQESTAAVRLAPDFAPGYLNLIYAYIYLNRLGEAGNTLKRAYEHKLELPDMLVLEYELAFLNGDQSGMERAVARATGRADAEDWMSAQQAFVLAYAGRLQQARTMSARAVDLARKAGQAERAGNYESGAAVLEALYGNATAATTRGRAALELSTGRDVAYGAAFAFALSGDRSESRRLTDDLERRFPDDTFVKFSYVPTLRALDALGGGAPSNAIDVLQVAAPYELGVTASVQFGCFGALYPVYARGMAYLGARQGPAAAAEFQKVLDHRGLVFSDPIGALARLQIGRAFLLSRDTVKAKAAYQDFLGLWKTADSDIPVLKQAKLEYRQLTNGN
jgi:tetratricopeptide (TPR) repeat protein